ncbi:hypothetical protein C5L28_000270 [Lentilactobacillus parakefiri]|uniref:Uncharacterized protein n=2 Tax=Lentilactobacillus parakefiri TaxID=152332 RepID=A0A224V6K6_9LACO|nr:hypothetical protein C5L28_000270 [Lentilactobacillus parakefiri]GAW72768.1 hypothetical protein LPKJCM_01898 [Lentilactobacillus parakefiri]
MFSVVTKYHKGRHSLFLYNSEIFYAFTQDILRSQNNDKTINIVNRIDYGTMIDAMDKMNQTTFSNTSSNLLGMIDNTIFLRAEASARYVGQKSGQKVSKGAHVHCNRFNGGLKSIFETDFKRHSEPRLPSTAQINH